MCPTRESRPLAELSDRGAFLSRAEHPVPKLNTNPFRWFETRVFSGLPQRCGAFPRRWVYTKRTLGDV